MSPSDRRAALVVLGLLALGAGLRLVVRDGAPGAVGYRWAAEQRPTRDTVAARAARAARPLGPGETVDVDAASAEELMRLPRVGPALAVRIVADRDANGPFGSLDALDRVAGIGPATLKTLRPHVRFSALPSAPSLPFGRGGAAGRLLHLLNTAPADSLARLPGIGPARARAVVDDRARRGPFRSVDDLRRVPGIGEGIVRRLTELRAVP